MTTLKTWTAAQKGRIVCELQRKDVSSGQSFVKQGDQARSLQNQCCQGWGEAQSMW